MNKKDCTKCFHYVICYAVGSRTERAEYCVKYTPKERVRVLPCEEGATVYRIVKYCEKNAGRKSFYIPTNVLEHNCQWFEQDWEGDRCRGCEDYEDSWYCSINLKVLNHACKARFGIEKTKFELSKLYQVYNTPLFDKNTPLEDTYFLTEESAMAKMEEIIND